MATILRQLRLGCAQALDDGAAYVVASGTSSTVTCAALVNLDPTASANAFDGAWAYMASGPSAGQQRRVRPGSYVPGSGTVTVDPPWGIVPSISEILEMTHLFPSDSAPVVSGAGIDDISYRVLVRGALGLLALPREVELATGTHREYPLAGLPWLDRQERLLGVREPGPTGGLAVDARWRGVRLVTNGPYPRLEIPAPFSSAQGALILDVLAPANTYVYSGGVWSETTTGLVLDDDATPLSFEDVFPAFLHVAYRALAARSPGRPYPKAADLADYWLGEARKLRFWDRTSDVAAPSPTPAAAA